MVGLVWRSVVLWMMLLALLTLALLTLTLKGERANVDVLNAMVLVANDYQNKLRSIQDNIAQLSENAAA